MVHQLIDVAEKVSEGKSLLLDRLHTWIDRKQACHKLDKSKIRLVILADSERGRTPYFDSDAIKRVDEIPEKKSSLLKSSPRSVFNKNNGQHSSNDSATATQDGHKYRFQKLGSDVKVLEEMMFGTAPISCEGVSLKVHVLRSPHKLMITKVFIPQKPRGESLTSDIEPDSLSFTSSIKDMSSGESFSIRKYRNNRSKPVDVPSTDMSDYGTDDDTGFASFTSSGSLQSSFPSPSNNSLSSYSSLHKRWMRSQITSFQRQSRKCSSVESNSLCVVPGKRVRRQKLSIAILFGFQDEKDEEAVHLFQTFVFSHFTLIESHIEKLRTVIEKAYFNLKSFIRKTIEALEDFRHNVYNLYMAPRLQDPVWLSMMSNSMQRPQLCEQFMKEFTNLVTQFDKKDCKFFVSTLLSAVLTQHLTWVATVTPADGAPTKTYLEKHSAKWVDTLAKTHPYNPLWAQLGDIFGAIGPPLKICRTIVVGKKADLVKRFLYILSYFIRCSDVHDQDSPCGLRTVLNDPPSVESLNLSAVLNDKTPPSDGSLSDEKQLFNSPPYSRPASLSSAGTSVFSGSQGRDLTNLTSLRNVDKNSSQDDGLNLNHKDTGSIKEPKFVYESDRNKYVYSSNSKDEAVDMNSPKHSVINDSFSGVGDSNVKFSAPDQASSNHIINHQSSKFHEFSKPIDMGSLNSIERSETLNIASCHSKSLQNKTLLSSPLSLSSTSSSTLNSIPNSTTVDKALTSHVNGLSLSPPDNSDKDSQSELVLSDLHTYCPESANVCSLTPLHGPKPAVLENVKLVGKHATPSVQIEENLIPRSYSYSEGKPISRLAQQLEKDGSASSVNNKSSKPTVEELRKLYLASGTSSMFDEYFDSGCAEGNATSENSTSKSLRNIATSPVENHPLKTDRDLSSSNTEVKSSLARQLSNQDVGKSLLSKPPTGVKHRSITPEMSRRRHLSSTGSMDYDKYDPLTHGKEVKLPFVFADSKHFNVQTFDRNFGRSLLAGYSEKYLSDFVLLGTSDKTFKNKLLEDLQSMEQSSFLDEHIEEAVCVIADTDTWAVEVASSKFIKSSPTGCLTWNYSQLVADLIESVVGIYKMKMGAEFCLGHLEDRLQEIYFRSCMLNEYLQNLTNPTFSHLQLTSMLGLENSDMSLLLAVAETHAPAPSSSS